jgi:hypothetical protein
VREIHPIFQNLHATRYYRKKVAQAYGVVQPAKSSIEDMLELQNQHPNMIQVCDITLNNFFISIKSDSLGKLVDFKNNPVQTDVTFSVFQDYDFCSSVIYSKVLERHVVIYAAIIRNKDHNIFERYFTSFFEAYGINFEDDDSFFGMLMDFSQAQAKGFLDAVAKKTGKETSDGLKFLKVNTILNV